MSPQASGHPGLGLITRWSWGHFAPRYETALVRHPSDQASIAIGVSLRGFLNDASVDGVSLKASAWLGAWRGRPASGDSHLMRRGRFVEQASRDCAQAPSGGLGGFRARP